MLCKCKLQQREQIHHVSLFPNLRSRNTSVNVSTKLFLLTAQVRVSTFADRCFARPPAIWLACPVLRTPGQKESILARVHECVAQRRQVDGPHIHVRRCLRLSARVSYTEQMRCVRLGSTLIYLQRLRALSAPYIICEVFTFAFS